MTDLHDDNIPNMIVPLIISRLRDRLEIALIDDVPDGTPTQAVLIKLGRFQGNPVKENVTVAISGGDYENPEYLDGRVDHEDLNAIGIRNLPVGEVGGGIYWWRRGTMNYQVFFVRQKYPEEIALKYAYDFYGRLISAVEQVPLSGLIDDYGETAHSNPLIEGCTFFESGGSDRFMWRGKLFFRVLTWRP